MSFWLTLPAILASKVKHIALLQLLIFSVTLLPMGLFHHHHEHDYEAEKVFTPCELAVDFNQIDSAHHCQHAHHIKQTRVPCFACDLHISHVFILEHHRLDFSIPITFYTYHDAPDKALREALIRLSNKGPPAIA